MFDVKRWSSIITLGWQSPGIPEGACFAEVVALTLQATATHLSTSPKIKGFLSELPKGPRGYCPNSNLDDIIEYVAHQRGNLDKSDPELNAKFMEEIMIPVFQFERNAILVTGRCFANDPNITTWLFSDATRRLAALTDQLWLMWYCRMAIPYQKLTVEEKEAYRKWVTDNMDSFDYTVFDLDLNNLGRGCLNRQTWPEAFPEIIRDIADTLQCLVNMNQIREPELTHYWVVLWEAYVCMDVDRLETCWAEVDKAWSNIPYTNLLVPVHGMENGYEHPVCVSPEFRVELRTSTGAEMLNQMRQGVKDFVGSQYPKIIGEFSRKLDKTDVLFSFPVYRAGLNLNMRLAGQCVPNRQEILAQLGGKTIIDLAGGESAADMYRSFVRKYCTEETATILQPLITPDEMRVHVVGHEFSHPIARSVEVDRALGERYLGLLEEAKATVLGLLSALTVYDSEEFRLTLVANMIARAIRMNQRSVLNNEVVIKYGREGMVLATTLFASGVMQLTSNGLSVNVDLAKRKNWFNELARFADSLITCYCDHDEIAFRRIEDMTNLFCDQQAEPLVSFIAWVNQEN